MDITRNGKKFKIVDSHIYNATEDYGDPCLICRMKIKKHDAYQNVTTPSMRNGKVIMFVRVHHYCLYEKTDYINPLKRATTGHQSEFFGALAGMIEE